MQVRAGQPWTQGRLGKSEGVQNDSEPQVDKMTLLAWVIQLLSEATPVFEQLAQKQVSTQGQGRIAENKSSGAIRVWWDGGRFGHHPPFLGLLVAAEFAWALFGSLPFFADSYAAQVNNSHSLYLHLGLLKLLQSRRGPPWGTWQFSLLDCLVGTPLPPWLAQISLDQEGDSFLFRSLAVPVWSVGRAPCP